MPLIFFFLFFFLSFLVIEIFGKMFLSKDVQNKIYYLNRKIIFFLYFLDVANDQSIDFLPFLELLQVITNTNKSIQRNPIKTFSLFIN